jgi:NAD(P)-dependent dehydrogenase (short-subunit alcohol dehydrogenase family)
LDDIKMTHSSTPSTRPVALITGASRGIGFATAKLFLARGFDLVLGARSTRTIGLTLPNFAASRVALVDGDVAEPSTRRALLDAVTTRFGRLDVLVNNSGHFVSRRFEDTSLEDLRRLFAVHLEATYELSRLTLPALERHGGAIVNVTTILTERALAGIPAAAQAAVKGGVLSLSKSLAHELGPRGVRVNVVAPGTVRTGIFGRPPEELDVFGAAQPLGRIGEPEEVAEAIHHLATAPFTTGAVLHVDGGLRVGSP